MNAIFQNTVFVSNKLKLELYRNDKALVVVRKCLRLAVSSRVVAFFGV